MVAMVFIRVCFNHEQNTPFINPLYKGSRARGIGFQRHLKKDKVLINDGRMVHHFLFFSFLFFSFTSYFFFSIYV